jgi:hypothetical protein
MRLLLHRAGVHQCYVPALRDYAGLVGLARLKPTGQGQLAPQAALANRLLQEFGSAFGSLKRSQQSPFELSEISYLAIAGRACRIRT